MADKHDQIGPVVTMMVLLIILNVAVNIISGILNWVIGIGDEAITAALYGIATNILLLQEFRKVFRYGAATITLRLPEKEKARFNKLMEDSGLSRIEVFRRALSLYDVAVSATQDGGRLLLKRFGKVTKIDLDLPKTYGTLDWDDDDPQPESPEGWGNDD